MKINAKDLAQISLFAALTAVGAFIKVPLPVVPFTLQTFFVALAGVLLGAKKGMVSQLVYVVIGLIGIPVFTKGGGIGYVVQPTFGYLVGFILGAFVTGLLVERMKKVNVLKIFLAIMAGLFVVYLIGVPYLYLINNFYVGKAMSIQLAVYYGFLLSIGGDTISLFIASILSVRLLPILRSIGLIPNHKTVNEKASAKANLKAF